MPRKIRQIRIDGNDAYVPLTKGYEAIIDAADVPLVAGFSWTAHVRRRHDGSIRAVYARRKIRTEGKAQAIWLHRVIAKTAKGFETDHSDGDSLNNRRSNLRTATASQNAQNRRIRTDNTSGFKGVSFDSARGLWYAQIMAGGRRRFTRHTTKEDAIAAYARASEEMHGEFGRLA